MKQLINTIDALLLEMMAKWAGVTLRNDASDTMIKALKERATEAVNKAESIQAQADSEERELTEEEVKEIDRLTAISNNAMDGVERRSKLLANRRRLERPTPTQSDSGVEVGNAATVD
ncbi:MAG: hypothetical protein HKO07_06735, partial [Pseudomonadales bacterium]|nr:hypothetical protein [Pseudomonadales bacterium]